MKQTSKLPNVFIVGTQKSGTTTLFNWMSQHPAIYANPEEKDYPYFSDESVYQNEYERFIGFYKSVPESARVVLGGEANAIYVPNGIERIVKLLPETKLIILLRNPVERYFSAWRYAVERDMEYRSIGETILDELNGNMDDPASYVGRQKNYYEHGLYGKQLNDLLRLVPRRNVKVIIYEELVSNTESVMVDIFSFVGVDVTFTPSRIVCNKTKGGARSKLINKLIYSKKPSSHKFWKMVRCILSHNLRSRIRRFLVRVNRVDAPAPEFPDKFKILLKNKYIEDRQLLEAVIDRRLSEWWK